MAVANTKSTAITNADATPPVLVNRAIAGADIKISKGICAVAAADDDNSVYRFARLPSNAVIHSIRILNDAITGGTAYHCGVWDTAENGGAVVDADLFASSVDISAGNTAWLELRYEAATTAVIDHAERQLWYILDLGAATLASDPNKQYDICLQGATVGTGAGDILMEVHWSV
jgi:hypothetical protein